jgi:hypothetical protein
MTAKPNFDFAERLRLRLRPAERLARTCRAS